LIHKANSHHERNTMVFTGKSSNFFKLVLLSLAIETGPELGYRPLPLSPSLAG
jgi:hypothetical protein